MDDDRLRLSFTRCYSALAMEARVALTLRMVDGLSVPEIARAFLVHETAMGQRITCARLRSGRHASLLGCRRGGSLGARRRRAHRPLSRPQRRLSESFGERDPGAWDTALTAEGYRLVRERLAAAAGVSPHRYKILAAINAVHTSARDLRDTH
jgi:predicted RNA polymerase sigma factor